MPEEYINWKLLKTELDSNLKQYFDCSNWCNQNGYHIVDDGKYYVTVKNAPSPEPTIQQQIEALEASITSRNIRNAILGDEYAINRVREIEAEIAVLREQLVQNGGSL